MDSDEPIAPLGGDLDFSVLGIRSWGHEPEILDTVCSCAPEDASNVEGLLHAVENDRQSLVSSLAPAAMKALQFGSGQWLHRF
jgi:hypothetical protein